jgi:hypothetical protein
MFYGFYGFVVLFTNRNGLHLCFMGFMLWFILFLILLDVSGGSFWDWYFGITDRFGVEMVLNELVVS